ncbi:MAG: hypothetical protein AB8H86_27410 [Polyangiales bacterium]
MKRATSLLGLTRQAISVRWNAASRGAKVATVALVAFAGVSVAQALTCGACGASCRAQAEAAPVAAEVSADEDHGCAYSNR